MHKTKGEAYLGRAALVAVMLGGGLLYAGISQAGDLAAQDVQAERAAELVAASGGPASAQHLIPYASDKTAVEERDDDVAPVAAEAAPVRATPVALTTASANPAVSSRIARADPDLPAH